MKIDDIKKLQQRKYRQQLGHYLVEGEHLIQELEKTQLANVQLMVTEKYQDWPTRFHKTLIGEKNMAALSDTKTPQGIVAVVPLPNTQPRPARQGEQAIYLHQVQDPGNLGTILRTLGWFGHFRCLLSPGSVDPFNPKVVRSSMGAIFHVAIEQDVSLDSLTERYPKVACLDMNGKKLSDSTIREFDAYVFGNEARGIPREALAEIAAVPYSITGSGKIESLNLASVVNMVAYELNR